MGQNEMIPHLFRTEFRKIVAVIGRRLGMEHLQVAEDIASETFLAALDTWPYKGVPENPAAWLYTVAKNKALNYIRRHQVFKSRISGALARAADEATQADVDLSEQNIEDSQLQMLFAICHPVLAIESQVGLALRILCGFGIEEIANAFLTSKETINKRLYRAKEKLREEGIAIEMPVSREIPARLDAVLRTVYLLFNEGYYSESNDNILREDLCVEAIRLTYMLTRHHLTDTPAVNALLALMCFHASRFKARKTAKGELVLYDDQNEALWDRELIARGAHHFKISSSGPSLTKYHLEAGIAFWHTVKADTKEKWENILMLYNHLLYQEYSPIAALNRTYALAKTRGREAALAEAGKLRLENNPYYHLLMAKLYEGADDEAALISLAKAATLVRTQPERELIAKRIGRLRAGRG